MRGEGEGRDEREGNDEPTPPLVPTEKQRELKMNMKASVVTTIMVHTWSVMSATESKRLSSFSRPQRSEVKVGGVTLGKSRTL